MNQRHSQIQRENERLAELNAKLNATLSLEEYGGFA